jgi:hypothetical protein
MHTRRILLGTIAVALAAAGCSSGSDNSVTTTAAAATSAAPATTAANGTSTTARTTTTGSATTTAGGTTTEAATVEDQARAALLEPSEVGPGFTADTWKPSDPSQPTPCGTPSVDATLPPQVQVGTVMGLESTQQALQEEISVYTSAEEATQAFQTGSAGLSCTAGTVTFTDGTKAPIAITPAVDVTDQVGGDQASAWQLRGGGIQGVLVAVELSGIVVTYQFTAPDTATDLQPDPLAVAKAGMEKILKS